MGFETGTVVTIAIATCTIAVLFILFILVVIIRKIRRSAKPAEKNLKQTTSAGRHFER